VGVTCHCRKARVYIADLWVYSAKRRHQSERFWATSIASLRERFNNSRSCWVVFTHIVRGCPGGLLQFTKVKLLLRFAWHLIHLTFVQRGQTGRVGVLEISQKCGCSVLCHTSSFRTWWYHLIHYNMARQRRWKFRSGNINMKQWENAGVEILVWSAFLTTTDISYNSSRCDLKTYWF